MFCCPRCSHLSTILNNVVEPESGVTILFNVVDSYEQCGQQNIVQSCFHQYCINLSVFTRVDYFIFTTYNCDITFLITVFMLTAIDKTRIVKRIVRIVDE